MVLNERSFVELIVEDYLNFIFSEIDYVKQVTVTSVVDDVVS